MEIQVNGNKEQFEVDALALAELLEKYEILPETAGVAVAVNFSVVPKGNWGTVTLKAGDEVEIIRATAGG